jgi:hypothetical protein
VEPLFATFLFPPFPLWDIHWPMSDKPTLRAWAGYLLASVLLAIYGGKV